MGHTSGDGAVSGKLQLFGRLSSLRKTTASAEMASLFLGHAPDNGIGCIDSSRGGPPLRTERRDRLGVPHYLGRGFGVLYSPGRVPRRPGPQLNSRRKKLESSESSSREQYSAFPGIGSFSLAVSSRPELFLSRRPVVRLAAVVGLPGPSS